MPRNRAVLCHTKRDDVILRLDLAGYGLGAIDICARRTRNGRVFLATTSMPADADATDQAAAVPGAGGGG